jgi:Ca2+/Na+ antiporter
MIAGISHNRIRHLFDTTFMLSGICIFALFIHGTSVQRMIAFAVLSVAAFVIFLLISDLQSQLKYLGMSEFSKKIGVYSLSGLGLGILFAVRCRSI